MLKGIILTLSACFIWGLIYVIPIFLSAYSPVEIALGRYFFFGTISLIFFGGICYQKLSHYPFKIWRKALWFALVANVVYYTTLVLAVQYSSATITALIAGIAPITISFYGNWKNNECSFNKLILPAILIIAGLITINGKALFSNETIVISYEYIIGLFCAFLALVSWTWYVVANTQFLKTYPYVTHFEWSTMLGVSTFFWVILISLLMGLFFMDSTQIQKYFLLTTDLKIFLGLTAILGCLCSWLGSYLWNSGCIHLPVSLAGQMTIFETVFGLIFVYTLEQRLPSSLEGIGFSFIFLAIAYSMNVFSKTLQEPAHT